MRPSETSWASQILSNMVLGIVASSIPSATPRQSPRGTGPGRRVSFSKWCGRSASKVTASPSWSSWRLPSTISARAPLRTTVVSRLPGSCIGGSSGPPVAAPASRVCSETSARWPGSGGVSSSKRWPPRVELRRPFSRLITTCSPSSRRSSCDSVRSRPVAIFAATAIVGLVSPRSTCESIGALTPLRSARSRRERPIASRRACTRRPTRAESAGSALPWSGAVAGCSVAGAAITFVRYHIQPPGRACHFHRYPGEITGRH